MKVYFKVESIFENFNSELDEQFCDEELFISYKDADKVYREIASNDGVSDDGLQLVDVSLNLYVEYDDGTVYNSTLLSYLNDTGSNNHILTSKTSAKTYTAYFTVRTLYQAKRFLYREELQNFFYFDLATDTFGYLKRKSDGRGIRPSNAFLTLRVIDDHYNVIYEEKLDEYSAKHIRNIEL